MKRRLCYLWIAMIPFIVSSCKISNHNHKSNIMLPEKKIEEAKPTQEAKPTAFEEDMEYLKQRGIILENLTVDKEVPVEYFLGLLVQVYESFGGKIDLSEVNPRNHFNEDVRKLARIGVMDKYNIGWKIEDSQLEYVDAANWLFQLQNSLENHVYWREDNISTIGDILRRLNVCTSLYTWKKDGPRPKSCEMEALLDENVTLEQRVTKGIAAKMMVKVLEEVGGEMLLDETTKLKDTEDIYARKAYQYFMSFGQENFQPDKTGKLGDNKFVSFNDYHYQMVYNLELDEKKVPFGAMISSLSVLMKGYEGMGKTSGTEKIVLNEKPYDWYVYQYETGEYSGVNCMPSCVEMAMRYQGLKDVPSTEQMRKERPRDGLGWYDGNSQEAMEQYGLKFRDSFQIDLEKMMDALDQKNILHVMYRDVDSEEGHAVIIKGYWKLGKEVNFIVSDPANNTVGSFGYPECIMDAKKLLGEMEWHVPRYFIIPPK